MEALAGLGDHDEAQAVTDRLRDLAEQQEHPWGLASARRCAALVRLAGRPCDDAGRRRRSTAGSRLVRRSACGRTPRCTLLNLGRAQRRHRRPGAARGPPADAAATAFDALGSPGWAEQARAESPASAHGARPLRGELTPAERRVVELAAEGRARTRRSRRRLFVTVTTV